MLRTLTAGLVGAATPADDPKPVFPIYLLPSALPFRRRSSAASTASVSPAASRRSSAASTAAAAPEAAPRTGDAAAAPLNDRTQLFRCATCHTHLCFSSAILSKGFDGRHGGAYLISGFSSPHIDFAPSEERHLQTGFHTVSDVSCRLCGTGLGWKYLAAQREGQRYKVGRFVLERERVRRCNAWEGEEEEGERWEKGWGRGWEGASEREFRAIMESEDVNLEDDEALEEMFRGGA